jgi:predicted NBD/HSP70 family sugar kinase
MRVGAANLHGDVLYSEVLLTPSHPVALRRRLIAALERAQVKLAGPVRAVGLSLAGIVHPDSQEISLTSNIEGWTDTRPPRWLSKFGAPLVIENEANMAAFSEYRYGAASGTRVALFLALGAGVGAGLLINGEVFRGATGAAGEIGLSRLGLEPTDDVLEREAAGPGLLAKYRRLSGAHLENPVELFTLAEQGDAAASSLLKRSLDVLAVSLANAILVLNPERVIVGGGLGTAGDLLLKPLSERVRDLLPISPPEFVLGRLGPDAALIGVAALVAQKAGRALVRELSLPD